MNDKNRKQIQKWIDNLEEIKTGIEKMVLDETDKYDNMPESLQESERGESIQEAIENLDSSTMSIDDAIEYLQEAKNET